MLVGGLAVTAIIYAYSAQLFNTLHYGVLQHQHVFMVIAVILTASSLTIALFLFRSEPTLAPQPGAPQFSSDAVGSLDDSLDHHLSADGWTSAGFGASEPVTQPSVAPV